MSEVRLARQRVFVEGLRLDVEIGVHGHEHGRRQPLVLDVEVDLPPRSAARLADTFDYAQVLERAQALAAGGHVTLVEAFAERLGRGLMEDVRVQRVRVRAAKPEALEPAQAAGVDLILERN